jgi:hypothetical protein
MVAGAALLHLRDALRLLVARRERFGDAVGAMLSAQLECR